MPRIRVSSVSFGLKTAPEEKLAALLYFFAFVWQCHSATKACLHWYDHKNGVALESCELAGVS
jgi:hypothetical protein